MSRLPLDDTLVVSVGHTLPGHYCMAALRDLGADVLRIERPLRDGGGDPYAQVKGGYPMRSLMAGTSECRLDLKRDDAREAFVRLASRAAVVLEGFRPGVAARLGIGYEQLSEANPALVHLALSGYGQEGPLRDRAGHDINYLAETGVLGLGNPPAIPGTTFADGLAGISAALNIVGALMSARDSGRGQSIDLAIVDAPLMLMAPELEHLWATGESRRPGDMHLTGRWPWYGLHRTRDDRPVALGAVEPVFHANLARGLDHPELINRQFAEDDTRAAAHSAFARAIGARSLAELGPLLDHPDACASPVRTPAEVASSPLMTRATRAGAADGERLVRTPVRSEPAPLRTERTGAEALLYQGFSPDEVEVLRRSGALSDRAARRDPAG